MGGGGGGVRGIKLAEADVKRMALWDSIRVVGKQASHQRGVVGDYRRGNGRFLPEVSPKALQKHQILNSILTLNVLCPRY